MSKNMTRKGLALGAAFALTATGLVATPAYAADLSLVASAGTTYNVLLSDEFTLNSAVTGNTNIANTAALKWEVVNTSGVTVGVSGTYWNTSGTPAYADSSLAADAGTTTIIYTPGSGKVTQTIGKVNTITLDPTTISTTATFSVTVRSFSDLDASGSVTSGDLVSDVQTVTFIKGSEVTGTVTMDSVNAGAAATATLTFDKDINVQMTSADALRTAFTVNGASTSQTVTGLNTAKTGFVLTGASVNAGDIVSAKATWPRYDGDSTFASATSTSTSANAASLATTVKSTIANNANVTTGNTGAGGATVEITKDLRVGTATLSYDMTFLKTASTPITAASTVTIVVTEAGSTLGLAEKVTVNGKTLTGTAGSGDTVTTYGLTDAAGKFTVTVTAANAKAADNIRIVATSGSASVGVDLEWVAAAIAGVYVTNDPAGDAVRTIAKGSSTSINYVVLDQFDSPWTRTDYSYRLNFTADGTATAPSALTLSNGAGTLVYTDSSTAASGAYNLTATLFSQTGVASWGTETVSDVTAVNVVAAIAAPATIATATALLDGGGGISASTGVPLADEDLAALDNRVYDNANAALGVTANLGAKLVATVTSATGANVQGAAVTVSAAGVYFSTTPGGSGVVSKDSIVLNTTAGGVVTVYAYSQLSGKKTITFTSGSATKTQDVTWAAAADDTGDALTISAPASATPGTTFKVTGKLVDEFGNGVKMANTVTATDPTLSVSYAGPGLVSGALPTSTNAAGEFVFYVLLGSNDAGSAVITASYDADGTTTTIAAIAATATVVVGSAGNVGVLATWTSNQNDGTVKMYAKNVVGAGKVQFMVNGVEIAWVRAANTSDSKLRLAGAEGAAYLVRTVDLVEGQKNVLEIYVDGVRTTRSAYTY